MTGSSRVLIVDDNLDTANSLAMILRMSGHDVHIASDGHAAIQTAMSVRPHLVLLDIGLPGQDGFAVATRLRQEASLAGLKIIAITGSGTHDDHRRAMDAGIDQYLLKPVDPTFLTSLLGAGGRRDGA